MTLMTHSYFQVFLMWTQSHHFYLQSGAPFLSILRAAPLVVPLLSRVECRRNFHWKSSIFSGFILCILRQTHVIRKYLINNYYETVPSHNPCAQKIPSLSKKLKKLPRRWKPVVTHVITHQAHGEVKIAHSALKRVKTFGRGLKKWKWW